MVGKKKKNTMFSLKNNDMIIEGTENLLKHATDLLLKKLDSFYL
jgi:hypothetical protein